MRELVSLLLLVSISLSNSIAAQGEIPPDSSGLEIIQSWMEETHVPSVAVAVIKDGAIDETWASNGVPGTLFDVASLTKTVTTLLTLKLVESGSWNLDDPLYPYWVDPDVVDNPWHRELTTRHVLCHQSGFKNWRWMREDKKLAFDFAPGTQFQYSGEGFEYLRKSLEAAFATDFERLADSLVFRPLGMESSYLVWNEAAERAHFAGAHDGKGKPYDYEKSYAANAADNLLTTVEDLAGLGVSILSGDFLREDLFREMAKPHTSVREGIDFGLGWVVFGNLPNGEYALFNAGSDQGGNALMVFLPVSRRGLVVLTNGDNGRQLAMKSIGLTLGVAGRELLERF